ncbi:unnamed protein product [Prorocentrum cordatum]|uniref:Uncharacterized protein n=1 Tax=Prorocentrum cordatum TaxID=2364126 RepID=A0ABN9TQB1_9DINO|nr:unnamed protein product [Polarella glacialis]
MGTGRDIKDTMELRESEMPMLKFMTSHAVKIKQDFRDNLDGRRNKKDTTLISTFCLSHSVKRCSCKKEHIHLQGYDKETHRKRTAAAAMFSKKFCTALCKDILALESKEPGISINKFSRAFPAAADDEAEDEAPLAQLPAPAGPKSLDDLMEEFKDIDTKSIKITLDTFTPTEAQWIKAAILSITDYTMSFGFDETEFSNPDDYKDRIRFLGNKDGHYHMSVVKDWRNAPEDDIDTTTTIYIITLLGKIEINGRVLSRTKPNMELRELPKKLTHANEKDRAGLLRLLHERFWHNSPLDMMKLLQAMLLPQAIVLQGMEICKACEVCQQWAKRHVRPQIKSFLATVFNEMVQHDLFFLWDETFMILIDEATKWKTGDHLINKTGPVLVKALNYLWIRIWGAMQNLLTDQEGGLMGHEATKLCDRLEINRLAIGKGGATTKGLCCAGHNCTLNYGGSTPQLALTGQLPRTIAIDSETITSMTGALEKRPDYMESMSRARLLARQAIVQSVIQDRLAQASKITQHQHEPELLVPGTICDIWREPARKDECGWRGPAEVISLERRAGSAIVKHQGQPLIIPLRHLRRHVLTEHYIMELNKKNDTSSLYIHYDLVNPTMVKAAATFLTPYQIYADGVLVPSETLYDLMDLVDGSTPTKIYWFGLVWQQEQYMFPVKKLAIHASLWPWASRYSAIRSSLCMVSCTAHKYVDFLRLNMHSGLYCYVGDERTELTTIFVCDQSTNYSTMMLYSYDHCEDLDKHFDPPELDWSDISMIDWPDDLSDIVIPATRLSTATTTWKRYQLMDMITTYLQHLDQHLDVSLERSFFIVNGLASGYAGYVLDTASSSGVRERQRYQRSVALPAQRSAPALRNGGFLKRSTEFALEFSEALTFAIGALGLQLANAFNPEGLVRRQCLGDPPRSSGVIVAFYGCASLLASCHVESRATVLCVTRVGRLSLIVYLLRYVVDAALVSGGSQTDQTGWSGAARLSPTELGSTFGVVQTRRGASLSELAVPVGPRTTVSPCMRKALLKQWEPTYRWDSGDPADRVRDIGQFLRSSCADRCAATAPPLRVLVLDDFNASPLQGRLGWSRIGRRSEAQAVAAQLFIAADLRRISANGQVCLWRCMAACRQHSHASPACRAEVADAGIACDDDTVIHSAGDLEEYLRSQIPAEVPARVAVTHTLSSWFDEPSGLDVTIGCGLTGQRFTSALAFLQEGREGTRAPPPPPEQPTSKGLQLPGKKEVAAVVGAMRGEEATTMIRLLQLFNARPSARSAPTPFPAARPGQAARRRTPVASSSRPGPRPRCT